MRFCWLNTRVRRFFCKEKPPSFYAIKNAFADKFVLDNLPIIVYNKDAPEGWQDREECGR